MGERIRGIMESYSLNAKELSERLGTSPGTVSHWLSGRNGPSYEVIVKIIEEFPTVSLNWLILGEGGMHREAAVQGGFTAILGSSDHHEKSENSTDTLLSTVVENSGVEPAPMAADKRIYTNVNTQEAQRRATEVNPSNPLREPDGDISVNSSAGGKCAKESTSVVSGELQMETAASKLDIFVLLPNGTYQRYTPCD
ncbi:MAG: hypothetical protein CSA97_02735 [Bacteroidetes bacterium]|nr:MAG: hypothetical protein CSA97_02735 [Bacteroidota bacterium]